MARRLVEAQASVNLCRSDGTTPLLAAQAAPAEARAEVAALLRARLAAAARSLAAAPDEPLPLPRVTPPRLPPAAVSRHPADTQPRKGCLLGNASARRPMRLLRRGL